MIELVIFDLDDTLYPEDEFTRSGFKAVAAVLAEETGKRAKDLFRLMDQLRAEKSSGVYDRLLLSLNLHEKGYLTRLIEMHRNHQPRLALFEDAEMIISRLKSKRIPLGLISDGYLVTQQNKVKALKLDKLFEHIILTDSWGREYWKPHTRAYEEMLDHFKLKPARAAYVGDNPLKDFIAPRRLGMLSIQVKREKGVYKDQKAPSGGEPDYQIKSLDELVNIISLE